MEIEGRLFTTALTADDVGAEDGSDVTKTLQIGEKEAEIVFKFKSPDPPSSSSIGTVDVDTSWKNAWSCDSYTGAEVQIEVNPIGSLVLYGSTTVEGRKPHTHGQLFIKDEIPEHGFIDRRAYRYMPPCRRSRRARSTMWTSGTGTTASRRARITPSGRARCGTP